VFTYVNPAVALAAGVLILNEPITVWHLAGLALILTGSVLATRRSDAEPAAIPTP
jgi:drug/metabolite transporter (DMT)-like permease